jgi:hypothetical protein
MCSPPSSHSLLCGSLPDSFKKYCFLLPWGKATAARVTCPQIVSESNILDSSTESYWVLGEGTEKAQK